MPARKTAQFSLQGFPQQVVDLTNGRTRVGRQRFSRFQILDHCAQINRLGIKCLVLLDLGAIQNLEAIALEHLFAAPAFERDDLSVNTFLTRAVKITQICAHERARRRNLARIREEINVKMRNAARCGWHFAPAVHERPTDEAPRALVVAKVAREGAKKEPNILIERVDLIPQGLARPEEITPDLASPCGIRSTRSIKTFGSFFA